MSGGVLQTAKEVSDLQRSVATPALLNYFVNGKQYCQAQGSPQRQHEKLSILKETIDILKHCVSPAAGKDIIVLCGITGSGKSMTANWIMGNKIQVVAEKPDDSDDEEQISIKVDRNPDAPSFKTGDSLTTSQTFLPSLAELSESLMLVDYPGFMDTSSPEIRIAMDVAFRYLLKIAANAHVVALIGLDTVGGARGEMIRAQMSKLNRLVPMIGCPKEGDTKRQLPEECCQWTLAVTKGDRRFTKNVKQMLSTLKEVVAPMNGLAAHNMVNLNKDYIFNTDATRQDFIEMVCRSTWKCNNEYLDSDCLSPADVASLSTALESREFVEYAAAKYKREYCIGGDIGDGHFDNWEQIKSAMAAHSAIITTFGNALQKQMKDTVETRILPIQRLFEELYAAPEQARLGSMCTDAETKMLIEHKISLNDVVHIIFATLEKPEFAAHLKNMDAALYNDISEKVEEAKNELKKSAQSMGFKDPLSMVNATSVSLGAVAAVGLTCAGEIGIVSMMTPAAFGTSSLMLIPGFTASLCGAAIAAPIGVVGLGIYISWFNRPPANLNDMKSVSESLIKTLDAVIATDKALTDFCHTLTATSMHYKRQFVDQ